MFQVEKTIMLVFVAPKMQLESISRIINMSYVLLFAATYWYNTFELKPFNTNNEFVSDWFNVCNTYLGRSTLLK